MLKYRHRKIEVENTFNKSLHTLTEKTIKQASVLSIFSGNIVYLDENGLEQTCSTNPTAVSNTDTSWGTEGSTTWYVVNKDITLIGRVTVKGNVHLILMDDYTLTIHGGINVSNNNSFTIYGQTKQSGKLLSYTGNGSDCKTYSDAAIGGEGSASITINSGTVVADSNFNTGGGSGAAIGGNWGKKGAVVTINGGYVTAVNTDVKLGIGRGRMDHPTNSDNGSFKSSGGGNSFIIATSISDQSDKANWKGVIFENANGKVYGTPTLKTNAEIPANYTLTIENGKTWTTEAGTVLTNQGKIIVEEGASFIINGKYEGGGSIENHGGTVTVPKTILTNPEVNNLKTTCAQINFTSNNKGKYYYLIYPRSQQAPQSNEIKNSGKSGNVTAGSNTIETSGLTYNTAYTAYFIVENIENNPSEILSIDFSTPDKEASVLAFNEEFTDHKYTGNPIHNPIINKTGSSKEVNITWQQKNGEVWENLDYAPTNTGQYKVIASVEADDSFYGISIEKEFRIIKETAGKPRIEIENITGTTITVKELEDTDKYGKAQYSIDNIHWQDNNEFTGLTGLTNYTIYVKYFGNENYNESEISQIGVKTLESDEQKLTKAKPLVQGIIHDYVVTNITTKEQILNAVNDGVSSIEGVHAAWKAEPTITKATIDQKGSITGTLTLTSGDQASEVTVNIVFGLTDQEKIDIAKPLAERILAIYKPTNTTTKEQILNAVSNGISSIEGVHAAWKAEPAITKATIDQKGSITGTLTLTSGDQASEVTVDFVFGLTDQEKIDAAKPLAEEILAIYKPTNTTTKEQILNAVNNGISSIEGVHVAWKTEPTITKATIDRKGSITGTLTLASGNQTSEVTVDFVFGLTDQEKIDATKPLAEGILAIYTPTNTTTKEQVLNAVNNGISSIKGVHVAWKAEPTITKATIDRKGSITGTLTLTSGNQTSEVTVNFVFELTDQEVIEIAQPFVEKVIQDYIVTNETTKEQVLMDINDSISIHEIKARWKINPNITKATWMQDGIMNGTLVLQNHETTIEIEFNKVIEKIEPIIYNAINSNNNEWIFDSKVGYTFKVDEELSKFIGIQMNGLYLDQDFYTTKSGSTIITLKPEYLNTLSAGIYEFTILFEDGYSKENLKLKDSNKINETIISDNKTKRVQTNDITNKNLYILLVLLSSGVIISIYRRRNSEI